MNHNAPASDSESSPVMVPATHALSARIKMAATAAVTLCLLGSALVHIGSVVYLTVFVPPAPTRAIGDGLPDRFVQMLMPVDEPEELLAQVEDEPEEEEPEAEAAWEAPTPEPEPEPEPAAEPEATNDAPVEAPGDGGGGIGDLTIGGGEGGSGPAVTPGRGGGGRRPEPVSDNREERREERREAEGRSEEDRRRVARIEDTSVAPCAQARREPEVPYPRELRERAISGTLRIQCIITETGRVRGCRHRSGPDELYALAAPIIAEWRCSPAENADGERVSAPYTFRIPFNLES